MVNVVDVESWVLLGPTPSRALSLLRAPFCWGRRRGLGGPYLRSLSYRYNEGVRYGLHGITVELLLLGSSVFLELAHEGIHCASQALVQLIEEWFGCQALSHYVFD